MSARSTATQEERSKLNGLLDTFRMLGPIESLDWLAQYFEGSSRAMAAHGHPAHWVDELVADVRALVVKYKAKSRG